MRSDLVKRILATSLAIISFVNPVAAIELCRGGNRAERKVTCIVDGDTIWQNGAKMRLLEIDTPETFDAQCDREKHLGEKATLRLQALMSNGYRLVDSGTKDRTSDHRNLVHVVLPDGRDAGKVLVTEGLAQLWPNKGNRWCDGRQGTGR